MFGPPKDVEGECNARLHVGDDYGDNHATMRCQLKPGHKGMHKEEYDSHTGKVVVRWKGDHRERIVSKNENSTSVWKRLAKKYRKELKERTKPFLWEVYDTSFKQVQVRYPNIDDAAVHLRKDRRNFSLIIRRRKETYMERDEFRRLSKRRKETDA